MSRDVDLEIRRLEIVMERGRVYREFRKVEASFHERIEAMDTELSLVEEALEKQLVRA
jgi:hypothetical protein